MDNISLNDSILTISSTEMNKLDECITQQSANLNLNINDNEITIKTYDINEKKMIASKIEQIKHKKIYLKLFKIISEDNSNYTVNTNGVFLNLNNLKDHTLQKIERVLNIYDNLKDKHITSKNKNNDSKWNEYLDNQYKTNSETSENFENKLTNHEKNLIKRTQHLNDTDVTYWE